MPRMRILSTQEQEDFDRPQVFGYAERKQMLGAFKQTTQESRRILH
jgi:hypothetical protein